MNVRTRGMKLVSILCALALVVGLVPLSAGAATPLMTETEAVETPVEDAGAMPHVHRHTETEEETAQAEEGLAALSDANAYSHNFTTDGITSSFFTITGSVVELSSAGIETTGEFAQYTKGIELKTATISFTAPSDGTMELILAHPSELKSFKIGTTAEGATKETTEKPKMTSNPYVYTQAVTKGSKYTVNKDGTKIHVLKIEFKPSIPLCADGADTWDDGKITVAPTCTESGVRTYTCSVCGKTKTETVDATGHTQTTQPGTSATCTTSGTADEVVCSICGEHLSGGETIPAKGHTYDNEDDTTCNVCGYVRPAKHTCDFTDETTAIVLTPATCTASGVRRYFCTVEGCEEMKDVTIPALGHDLKDVSAQAASCTTVGYSAHKACSRCDYKEGYTEIPVTGHSFGTNGVCTVCGASSSMTAGGWFETLYAEVAGITAAQVSQVYYSGPMTGILEDQDMEYLIRDAKLSSGESGVRVDIPGLAAGTYSLVITADGTNYTATGLEVKAYDRSGYAHKVHTTDASGKITGLVDYTEGVGAYRDDGILKDNAIVLYVTEENKNTVTLTADDGTTVTGIGNILNSVGARQKEAGAKMNTNQGILQTLALEGHPLVVRIVGTVKGGGGQDPGSTPIEGLTAYDSADYGGTVGDNGFMARMENCQNITIEGIGPDATIYGWGFHTICGTAGYTSYGLGKNFEFRNLTFMECPEDCIGMEGQQAGGAITAPVRHGWVHNCNFYPAHIASPAESDKKEGDGACDFKRGEYFTMSYCYYESCHKTNLIGSSDDSLQFHITWHHNYWKNCEARGPLVRNSNIHIYNCIYEGQISYAMNPRANAYIFSEYNAFINCKNPVQVDSGAVKSYQDSFTSCIKAQDTTPVTDKSQTVSTSNTYANFDTKAELSYIPGNDYLLDRSLSDARANVLSYTGPMKTAAELGDGVELEVSYIPADRIPADPVVLTFDKDINTSYTSATADHIYVNGNGGSATALKIGKQPVGADIVFKVDQAVDITVTDGSGTNPVTLVNSDGVCLLTGSGTASNCPKGVYCIQSSYYDVGSGKYNEASISHLKIAPTATAAHSHVWDTGVQIVAPTCTKEGSMLYTCSCGEQKTEAIAKIDHEYADGVCVFCELSEGVYDPTNQGGTEAPEIVAVTGVSLNTTGTAVDQDSTVKLVATVTPTNATKKTVSWSSSDEAVATVNGGTVKGVGPGVAIITATTADGGYTATCEVRVIGINKSEYSFNATDYGSKGNDAAVTEAEVAEIATKTENHFTLTKAAGTWKTASSKVYLVLASQEGNAMEFTVTQPTNKLTISASSTGSNNWSALALLDASGNRVANADGETTKAIKSTSTTTITFNNLPVGTYHIVAPANVTAAEVVSGADITGLNGRGVGIHTVTLTEIERQDSDYVAVESVTISQTSATLTVGETLALTASVEPGNATYQTVSWSSGKPTVATVSGGVVTAKGEGTATITASCGGKTATCTVTVEAPKLAQGNFGAQNELSYAVSQSGILTLTDEGGTVDQNDILFAVCRNTSNGLIQIRILRKGSLTADVGTDWKTIQLIWVNNALTPRCDDKAVGR